MQLTCLAFVLLCRGTACSRLHATTLTRLTTVSRIFQQSYFDGTAFSGISSFGEVKVALSSFKRILLTLQKVLSCAIKHRHTGRAGVLVLRIKSLWRKGHFSKLSTLTVTTLLSRPRHPRILFPAFRATF